jgi:hypothetical protein
MPPVDETPVASVEDTMTRRIASFVAVAGTALMVAGTSVAGQAPRPAAPAAPAAAAPAAPKLAPPVRGQVSIAVTKPVTKAGKVEGKDFIITTMKIKNLSTGAIAGFKADEFWLDKGGNPVGGDTFRSRKPIQPNEVVELTFSTPRNPSMNNNQYRFSHANGEVKTQLVAKL